MATKPKKCGKAISNGYNESTTSIENVPIAFKIPKQSSYQIKLQNKSKEQFGRCYTPLSFRAFDTFKGSNFPPWLTFTSYKIEIPSKKHQEFVVAIHIENKAAVKLKNNKEELLIYSHENNVDVCNLLPHIADLSVQLKCNVITYDYSGFGCSGGTPNIESMKKNIALILDFVNQDMNIPLNRIMLYGKDIGAFPSLFLSMNPIYKQLKGIIMVSPILGHYASDLRKVKCPLLIIHPKNDKMILSSSISDIIQGMKNAVEWFPKAQDIEEVFNKHRYKLFTKIRSFIEQIENMNYTVRETIKSLTGSLFDDDVVYVEFKQEGEFQIKDECFKLDTLLSEKLDKSVVSSVLGGSNAKGCKNGTGCSTGVVSDIQSQSNLLSQSQDEYSRNSINNCSIYRETYFSKNIFDSDDERDEIDTIVQTYY